MCYRFPGKRCANSSVERTILHHKKRMEETRALIEQIDSTDFDQLNSREHRNLRAKYRRARIRLEEQNARLPKLQTEYDITTEGMSALRNKALDTSLSESERNEASERLAKAQKISDKRMVGFNKREVKKHNLVRVLKDSGVPSELVEVIRKQADADGGIPHPRSAKDYKKSLDLARKQRKQLLDSHEAEEATIRQTATKQRWSDEATESAVAKAKFTQAVSKQMALEKLRKARFAYECTAQGQRELEARIDSLPASKWEKRDDLAERLRLAKKVHAKGLSDRESRVVLNRLVKEAMKEQGLDPQIALDAMKKTTYAPDPALAFTSMSSHMNEADEAKARARFESSKEYKELGDAGYSAYVTRVLLSNPRRLQTDKNIDEANAKAKPFDQGIPRRHKRSQDGVANIVHKVSLEQRYQREISDRASTLRMSKSSYIRAVLIGQNPFARQNDRSKEFQQSKTEAMKALMGEA